MNLSLQPLLIDIIIAIVIIFMMVMGYIKGFVVRIYDLLATFVALGMSLFLSGPISEIFVIYRIEGFAQMIGAFINRIIIFIILYIGARILLRLLGIVVKPILRSLVSKIGFIQKFDHLLGVILGFMEACVVLYMVLIMIITPLFSNGQVVLEETLLAKPILNIVPPITKKVMDISHNFQGLQELLEQGISYDTVSGENVATVTSLMNRLYESNAISEDYTIEALTNYFDKLEATGKTIVLTKEQYEQVQSMLEQFDTEKIDKQKIYEILTVRK